MYHRTSASGGVGTAAGLGYQYLVTVEDVLDWMEQYPDEDFVLESEDHISDAVDYSITDPGGTRLLSVQAKSSVDGPDGTRLGGPEITGILLRLIEHDARRYAIRTNRRLTATGEVLRDALASLDPSTATSATAIEAIGSHLDPVQLAQVIASGVDLSRLARCAVLCDLDDLDVLRSRIERKAQYRRRLRGDGTGQHTAAVLVGYLTSQVLRLSSRREDRSLGRVELDRLVGTPAPILAGAAGNVDWAVPVGPVPTTLIVGRADVLGHIVTTLAGPPIDTVRRVALTGLSGIGKSTMARLYLDVARHYYDRILWLDAHSDESICDAASAYLGIDTVDVSADIVAERFKATISSAPATWLIIFDNAPDARALTPWLPIVGAIDIIATSTNATGWIQWHPKHLLPMTEPQAFALVRERLGLDRIDADADDDVRRLCDALGNWPLAIELACAYLADAGRGLAMTDVYLARLRERVIDDETLVPPEYRSHSSLLQAITVALETVASRDGRLSLRAMALLDTLAYLPPRSAPLRFVGRVTTTAEFLAGQYDVCDGDARERDATTEHDVDTAVRQLSTASLVCRVGDPDTSWGDMVRTNEIVLDVVRGRHDDAARLRVLGLLQMALHGRIMSAVDHFQFAEAAPLTASALTVINFSERLGIRTRESITLIGNLAAMLTHDGDLEAALSLYRRELTVLDQMDIDAPILRAKIHAGISALQLRTNAPVDEIRHTIDFALYFLGRCATDLEARDSAATAAMQVYETVQLLASTETTLTSEVTGLWTSFLVGQYPDVDAGRSVREFHAQLGSVDNDDAVTLVAIEGQLRAETSLAVQIQLLFLRGDTLASLGRYAESIEAFRDAFAHADARAIGAGLGWVEILNAWRAAAFSVLGSYDPDALAFCRHMEALIGGERPTQEDDRTSLELCCVATRVLDRPLHEFADRLERLADRTIAPSLLRPHPEGERLAVAACQRIARLRQSVGGAPIVPLRAWGRVRVLTPRGLRRSVAVAVDLAQIEDAPSSGLTGRWVCDEWGVGLAIGGDIPMLAWSAALSTWWMGYEGATTNEANVRLREVITSPEFAAYRGNVLAGSAYEASDTEVIDPNGPTVDIEIRD